MATHPVPRRPHQPEDSGDAPMWRELGETPTAEHRRLLPLEDPRWSMVCERVGYRYYLREWTAREDDGYEHYRVEVGQLGPVKWTEQT